MVDKENGGNQRICYSRIAHEEAFIPGCVPLDYAEIHACTLAANAALAAAHHSRYDHLACKFSLRSQDDWY